MQDHSEQLIQRLGRRYFGVLVAVVGLLLLDQAVLQPLLVRLNFSAPVMNLAGRQRMLSQRLTKAALVYAHAPAVEKPPTGELQSSLGDWARVHAGLQFGDEELQLPGTKSPVIQAAFARLNPHFQAMHEAVQVTLNGTRNTDAAVHELLLHEQEYLSVMEQVVALWEAEAQAQVLQLRSWGLAITGIALCLLGGLAVLVLKPATRLIRNQVRQLADSEAGLRQARDELEVRVLERTRELRKSNRALAREVVERELAEERSRQLQTDLAHASRVTSLGQLATGLAHELNQPLGAMTNYSEALLILAGDSPPRMDNIRTTSQRIRDAALRAGRIVSRMRNFVQPKEAVRSGEQISELIRDVLAFCEPELRQHRVSLQLDLPDNLHTVLIDPIQIQQVLVNIIQNAVQAMSTQERTPRNLRIEAVTEGERIVVRVDDNGPGFPPQSSGSMFRPFQSTKPDGLGMGLSISESLIAAHGGTLCFENLPSCGARVQFSLPSAANLERPSANADCLCRG